MRVISAIGEMQRFSDAERRSGRRIGFVPTMGALHDGHLSLVCEARKRSDTVVVSIFVNPIQFDSKKDFERYPRDEADGELLEGAGVDALFCPDAAEMYPPGFETRVEVTDTSTPLCGAHRPGHFAGVTTVVSKLFLAVKPHVAVFGGKDYQQLQVVRRMVRDLNFDVEVVAGETVREADGLAMSSRNRRLSPAERRAASRIPRALEQIRHAVWSGERERAVFEKMFARAIAEEPSMRLEYADLRDCKTLRPLERLERSGVFAVAVWVGEVRLIDNVVIETGEAAAAAAGGTER